MQYLEALGVDIFVPRVSLPEAKPSVFCLLPEPDPGERPRDTEVESTSVAQPGKTKSASEVICSVVDALEGATPGDTPQQNPQPENQDVPQNVERDANFVLSLWRPSSALMVVDSRVPGAALPTDRLLENMLRHSRWRIAGLPQAEIQRWPMVADPNRPQGWAAAKDMMGAFLDGRLLSQPVEFFIVLGEEAYRAVNGESVEQEPPFAEVCFKKVRFPAYAVEALVFPSLASILESPQIKERIWGLIR